MIEVNILVSVMGQRGEEMVYQEADQEVDQGKS